VLWLVAGTAATGLACRAASELLRSEELAFPHPFLLAGLSQAGALLLCRLAARVLDTREVLPPPHPAASQGGPPTATSSEAEWKAAGILGLMYGVDVCIGASILYHLALASRDASYVLSPAVMLGAGILAGCDKPEKRCLQSIAGVTLGGLLMAVSGFSWAMLEMGLLALLADVVKMFRWVFTKNVLPDESGAPLLIFAARMATTTAALGFELTFVTDFSSYAGLFYLPRPGQVAALVLATSLGTAVKTVSELHLAQLTSVTVLGFFTPLLNAALTLLAAILGGNGASITGGLGALTCLGGVGFYGYLRQGPHEAEAFIAIDPPMPSASYARLQADGPPGHARRQQLAPPSRQPPAVPLRGVQSAPAAPRLYVV